VTASSYAVDSLPTRTVAVHGMTGAELRRLNGASHQMLRVTRSQGELWWLTTPKGSTRDEIAACQKRITREQSAHGFPTYSVWVFETRSKLHAHIVFLGNRDIANALRRSRLCIDTKIERVTDIGGLKKYLAKERTPQAGYRRGDLGGRIAGSHRLPGGGDRVRLSRQLERDAIEAGLVDPWKHTNAKRSAQRKDYPPRRSSHNVERQGDPLVKENLIGAPGPIAVSSTATERHLAPITRISRQCRLTTQRKANRGMGDVPQ
jgi:hypothetical protein